MRESYHSLSSSFNLVLTARPTVNGRFNPRLLLSVMILVFCLYIVSCTRTGAPPAPAKDSDSLTFVVLGDWGKDGNQPQLAVAAMLDSFSRRFHASFIITTGDNFYPNGVSSVNDAHWQASFERVFNKPGHMVAWYPVLGNHDYESSPQAEIDYSAMDSRWHLPSRYYSIRRSIGSTTQALFLFTDTSPFIESYYSYGTYPDLKRQDTAAQLAWLKQTLAGSTDQWKIVVGHHPVYSTGVHSSTPELIAKFQPLFAQTGTNFYLCGHDHSLQSISMPGDHASYLVSGGGSEHTPVYPNNTSLFSQSSLGFLIITLYPQKARYYFVSEAGACIYEHEAAR